MRLEKEALVAFARALLDWYAASARDLPWRREPSPYRVWVSEVMLQQTQAARAAEFFERWMARFDSVAAVAAASDEALLKAWEGLGYYARARHLREAAKIVMAAGGALPDTEKELRALPGIGPYTAAAIAAIGFNRPAAAIDANVERVFSRLLDIDIFIKSRQAHEFIASVILAATPPDGARAFTQAIMELGALVCLPKNPGCAACPVREFCEARRLGLQDVRPVLRQRRQRKKVNVVTGVLIHAGRVFIQKRPPYGAWASMWEFPGGGIEKGEAEEAALVREFFEETEIRVRPLERIADLKFSFTHIDARLAAWLVEALTPPPQAPPLHAAVACAWVRPDELGRYPFPAGMKQLVPLVEAMFEKAAGA